MADSAPIPDGTPIALYPHTRDFHNFFLVLDLDNPVGYRHQDPLWQHGDDIDRFPISCTEHPLAYEKMLRQLRLEYGCSDPASKPPLALYEYAVLPGYARPRIGVDMPDYGILWTPGLWKWAGEARTRLICKQLENLSTAIVSYSSAGGHLLDREQYDQVLSALLAARKRCGSTWSLRLAKFR